MLWKTINLINCFFRTAQLCPNKAYVTLAIWFQVMTLYRNVPRNVFQRTFAFYTASCRDVVGLFYRFCKIFTCDAKKGEWV